MSGLENTEVEIIQNYSATPQKQTAKELGKFRQFVEYIAPYFKRKREQAERIIEARVKNEEAQARKTNAEALKTEMEAVKLAQEIKERAMQIDQNSTIPEATSPEEIQEGLDELNELIQMLGLKYGTTIRIEENTNSQFDARSILDLNEFLKEKYREITLSGKPKE